MSDISPFFRSFFTDITGAMMNYQMLGRCARQEMEMMDCMEAYGLDKGAKKCKDYIDDLYECQKCTKQFARVQAMRIERERQIKCGKLTGDKKYVNPRVDSY